MIAQLIGWIGNCGFFFGAIYVVKKNVFGWWLQLLANVLYIWQSVILDNYSLLWLSVILSLTNIYGIYKWSKR
jgi:nicotinamide riboside transporter PnuC